MIQLENNRPLENLQKKRSLMEPIKDKEIKKLQQLNYFIEFSKPRDNFLISIKKKESMPK